MQCIPILAIKVLGSTIAGLSEAVCRDPNSGFAPSLICEFSAGESSSVLDREIAAIQELLDEQPDSKCMQLKFFFLSHWLM